MHKRIRKVVAYVVRGDQLLVFTHRDEPEAGLQVPAGTIQKGERAREAVLREVKEEAGISDVLVVKLLGRTSYDMAAYGRDEVQDRYVYHLTLVENAPSKWVHYEIHDGLAPPSAFQFFWMPLENPALDLAAGQGELLVRLKAYLVEDAERGESRTR